MDLADRLEIARLIREYCATVDNETEYDAHEALRNWFVVDPSRPAVKFDGTIYFADAGYLFILAATDVVDVTPEATDA
jgi:hypothetical protein